MNIEISTSYINCSFICIVKVRKLIKVWKAASKALRALIFNFVMQNINIEILFFYFQSHILKKCYIDNY